MSPIAVAHLGLFVSAMIVGASFPIVSLLSEAMPPLPGSSSPLPRSWPLPAGG